MANVIFGSTRFSFSTLPSTNRFAQELLSKTRPRAGTVISAAHQTAGEGQFGRSWFGTKGKNLSVSVILYPGVDSSTQFRLNAAVALAVRATISIYTDRKVTVKWPNDIYVDDYKIGGILIQNTISGKTIQNTIVGIGLNINEIEFPDDIPNPTSLVRLTGLGFSIQEVLDRLLEQLDNHYHECLQMEMTDIIVNYQYHMFRFRETAHFTLQSDGSIVSASISGVDAQGRIILEGDDIAGPYSFGEVKHEV